MALNRDEFQQRRRQREQQRQEELVKQKKLIRGLLTAAAILLLVGLLILAVSRRGHDTPPDPTQQTTAAPVTQPTGTVDATEDTSATEEAVEPTTVITFAIGGDLTVTDKVVASGGENLDYTLVFQDVMPILAGADLCALNFEGAAIGAPYGGSKLSAPQSMLQALANAGVDMLQMANSKTLYNGLDGLATTLSSIRAAGMEPLGAYSTKDEFELYQGYSVFRVKDILVGVIAFTKGMDGMAMPEGNNTNVNILYQDYASTYQKVYKERIEWLMEEVSQENPDVVIALLHWGSEYNDTISKTQKTIRDMILDAGADAIVGTHSHYVQAIEHNQEDDTVVAYSLGNFFSDADRAGTEYSIILELEITMDNETNDIWVSGYDYVPIFTVRENDTMRVVRLREAMAAYEAGEIGRVSAETYASMKAALERIEARVKPKTE